MAEVSEQEASSQDTPEQQQDAPAPDTQEPEQAQQEQDAQQEEQLPAPQQEPSAEQPEELVGEESAPEQEEPLEDLEDTSESEQPFEDAPEDEPPELAELTRIIGLLDSLAALCDRTQERIDLSDAASTQEVLQQYATGLAYIPKILQLVQDYRRHKARFDARAKKLHEGLRAARKDDNALSSEEERVIASAASLQETLLSVIGSLERALAHVRASTHDLLSLIAYAQDGFAEYAKPLLSRVNIGMVSSVAHKEHQRVLSLKRDVIELRSFEDHLQELSSEQEDA